MDRVIQLLTDKNQFLEKFYGLNESEILNFSEGNFDNLETFYNSRETILEMLSKIDVLIDQTGINTDKDLKFSDIEKKEVLEALSEKNDLVTQILSQDLQILSFIEQEKSEIIKELATVQTGRKALKSYHTGSKNRELDEEA